MPFKYSQLTPKVRHINTVASSLIEISRTLYTIKDLITINSVNSLIECRKLDTFGVKNVLVLTPRNIDKDRKAIWLELSVIYDTSVSNKEVIFAVAFNPGLLTVDKVSDIKKSPYVIGHNAETLLVKLSDVKAFIDFICSQDYVNVDCFIYRDLKNIEIKTLRYGNEP